MIRRILALAVAFGLLAQTKATAAQVQITWDELANVAVEKTVSMVLPDGTKLQGEVLAVRSDALLLDVRHSSKKKVHPLGQTEVPRAGITEVVVIRHRTPIMRIIGGIGGTIGGFLGVIGLSVATDSVAFLVPGLIILVPLGGVGGYYLGKLADRNSTHLMIAPASQEE